MPRLLTEEEIERQLRGLAHWSRSGRALVREVELRDWSSAVAAVVEVAEVATEMDHHPDIDLRWRALRFACCTHAEGGITQFDVELAHRIEEVLAAQPLS